MEWITIADTRPLEGRNNLRKPSGSHSQDLGKHLTRMLRHFTYQDPPDKQVKAISLGLVMAATAAPNPFRQLAICTADLILIALFLFLRSCE